MFPDIRARMMLKPWLLKAFLALVLILVQLAEGKSFYPAAAAAVAAGQQAGVGLARIPEPQNNGLVPFGGEYEKELLMRGLQENGESLMDEDGSTASMETAIMNYLNTKRMIQKMKQQIDAATTNSIQQRKRTNNGNGNYWKMCAFNAVSCFG